MSNLPRRHVEGPRQQGLDYFEDREFASEVQSLGGTEAARITNELEEAIHPNGLNLKWNCNCGRPVSILVEWHEIAAIAHNVSPAQPLPHLQGRALSGDPWKEEGRRFYPHVPGSSNNCPGGCGNPREVFLVKRDGERALTQGIDNGFVQNDPRYRLAQQVFNPERQRLNHPPI